MTLGTLDRKSAITGGIGLALVLIVRFGFMSDSSNAVVTATESIPQAEKRLQHVRSIAATVPGKQEVLKLATAEMDAREKGVLKSATESQAEALLLEIVNNVAKAQGVSTRGMEEYHSKPLSGDYGEISITVSFNCDITQLVNFLAGLADQDPILATNDIRVTGTPDKKKVLNVRLSVAALVPRKLLPEKKGGTAF
jgi:Tfp pilus assembly protein PilO